TSKQLGSPASLRAGGSSSDDPAPGGTSKQLGSPASLRAGVIVATTRPETMLGDTAVAVHPDDERYRALVGKHVLLPLRNRVIPIVADAAVEREFGTGAVKVTPAHDATDYDIGVRHGLAMPSVIGLDAKMTAEAGEAYQGLDRDEARKRVVADLQAQNFLVATESHHHSVAACSRCGTVIEPLLSLQWFVKMESLAKPGLEALRDGRLRFVPERHGRTYAQWLENIRDWNISRQVWWGHRLPVWYTPDGEIVVAESEDEAKRSAREQYGSDALTRDEDTLDTWFSSGLWPFSILGWPKETKELAAWYPTQVLITAQEIIFLWVARMVMLGMHFVDGERPPFKDVLITPLVFDQQGRKMSKSLGNSIDPLDLIEKYGADATRLGIIRQMHLESQELRFSESRCEESRNFNNKIWNAARYVLSLPDLADLVRGAVVLPQTAELTLADRWILARLRETVETATRAYESYEFSTAADRLWKFLWNEYCDWYLEATKQPSPSRAAVLTTVLDVALRLLHPIEPFITEEIWQMLPQRGHADGQSIARASWPRAEELPGDGEAAARFDQLMEAIVALRRLRADAGIPARDVPQASIAHSELDAQERALVERLARVSLVAPPPAGTPGALTERLAELEVALLVGKDGAAREIERLRTEERRLIAEVERLEKKLANASFALKAPPDIVQKEREKLAGYAEELQRTRQRLTELKASS
ncbi:valine--tRNA ligase, partial [bacterium]